MDRSHLALASGFFVDFCEGKFIREVFAMEVYRDLSSPQQLEQASKRDFITTYSFGPHDLRSFLEVSEKKHHKFGLATYPPPTKNKQLSHLWLSNGKPLPYESVGFPLHSKHRISVDPILHPWDTFQRSILPMQIWLNCHLTNLMST